MATQGGYDFKADITGWECWRQWLSHRDPKIALKCLEGHYPVTFEFGAAVALSSCDPDLIHQFLTGCSELSEPDQRAVAFMIARWGLEHESLRAQLNPDEQFWKRFNAAMKDFEALWLTRLPE